MIIDLTRRAPFLIAHECTRSIVVRTCSIQDLVTARVVGHLVLEPVATVVSNRVTTADFCLSVVTKGTNAARELDFKYTVTTGRVSNPLNGVTDPFVQDTFDIEIGGSWNQRRPYWLITVRREAEELVATRVDGIIPGVVESSLPMTGNRTVWDWVLDDFPHLGD